MESTGVELLCEHGDTLCAQDWRNSWGNDSSTDSVEIAVLAASEIAVPSASVIAVPSASEIAVPSASEIAVPPASEIAVLAVRQQYWQRPSRGQLAGNWSRYRPSALPHPTITYRSAAAF